MSSIEQGLNGHYEINIEAVVKEAWGRVSGNKGTIWLALIFYVLVLVGLSILFALITGEPLDPVREDPTALSTTQVVEQLLTMLVAGPIGVGIYFLGVAIASDEPASAKTIFAWFDKTLKLFLTYLLMGVMITLGMMLLILPGIYLAVAYQFALPLVADKNLGPWAALEASRKTITHKWFTFFGLWLVVTIAILASGLLAGIPLIWVLPAFIIGSGIVYRQAFGAEQASLTRAAG